MVKNLAGCYHCLRTFRPGSVNKYTSDGEMICPFCGIDAVLDGVHCSRVLRRQQQKNFGTKQALYPKNRYGDK